jgi:hypothetical protein
VNAILFVSLAGDLGGSTRSLATVLHHLEGDVTRILAAPARGNFSDLAARRGLMESHIPLPERASRFGRASRLVAALRLTAWALRNRGRVTAIHANGTAEVNVVAVAAWILGVPIVAWCHHYDSSEWMRRLAPVVRRLPVSII